MNSGFQYLDIILYAVIALFLVLRLGNVLGRKTGHRRKPGDYVETPTSGDRQTHQATANDNSAAQKDRAANGEEEQAEDPNAQYWNGPAGEGLRAIKEVDPNFSPMDFLKGADAAFSMILHAYAKGDRKTLSNLLAPDVYDNFEKGIKSREEADQRLEDTLVGLTGVEFIEAGLQDGVATITLKYTSEQIHVLYDAEDEIIEGNPRQIDVITDFWTFARDPASPDPNWALVATHSPE